MLCQMRTYSKLSCRCVTRLLSSSFLLSGSTTHFLAKMGAWAVNVLRNMVSVRLDATTMYHLVVKSSNSPCARVAVAERGQQHRCCAIVIATDPARQRTLK